MCIEQDACIIDCESAIFPKPVGSDLTPKRGGVVRSYTEQNPLVPLNDPNKPKDYTIDIYSTFKAKLYAQYTTNMITPVLYRPNMRESIIASSIKCGDGVGVFVIERYHISSMGRPEFETYLNYITNTRGLSYCDGVIEDIVNRVHDIKSKRGGGLAIDINIITFMPKEHIVEGQYSYMSGPGITICQEAIPDDLYHPFSKARLESTTLPDPEGGGVCVSLVLVSDDTKPRYFMIGNKVSTIRPTRTKHNTVLPSGCSMVISKDGVRTDETYIRPEEFEDYGLYRSRDACVTNGNKALLLEERNMENAMKRAIADKDKIELGKEKVVLEKEKVVLETEKLDADREHAEVIQKHKVISMDLDMCKISAEIRKADALAGITVRTAGAKAAMDITTKRVVSQLGIDKALVDREKAEFELGASKAIHKLKITEGLMKLITRF